MIESWGRYHQLFRTTYFQNRNFDDSLQCHVRRETPILDISREQRCKCRHSSRCLSICYSIDEAFLNGLYVTFSKALYSAHKASGPIAVALSHSENLLSTTHRQDSNVHSSCLERYLWWQFRRISYPKKESINYFGYATSMQSFHCYQL